MTTIKLTGGDLGRDWMQVRCDLANASSPVQVDYGDGFSSTQYQCADTRHRVAGLIEIGKRLAAAAVEVPESAFNCEANEVLPTISISANGLWAGDGILRNGTIEDCAAILGGTQDEADRLYEAIEQAIESGDESLVDGEVTYAWTIG